MVERWEPDNNVVFARKEASWAKVERDTIMVSTSTQAFYLYLEEGLKVCRLVPGADSAVVPVDVRAALQELVDNFDGALVDTIRKWLDSLAIKGRA